MFRLVSKSRLLSKVVENQFIAICNLSSRTFSVVQESQDFPENSETSDQFDEYFEPKHKQLLHDINPTNHYERKHVKQNASYSRRIRSKLQKSHEYEDYPQIFRDLDSANSTKAIVNYVDEYISSYWEHNQSKPKQSRTSSILDELTRMVESGTDTQNQENDTQNDENIVDEQKEEKNPELPAGASVYTHAMRACFSSNFEDKYETAWKLYDDARSKWIVSNDLYSMALFGKMHESRTKEAVQECFDMFDEWKKEEKHVKGLRINPRTYASLMACCNKCGQFGKGFHVLNNLILTDLDEYSIEKVLTSASVRQEIVQLYCNSQSVESALQFINKCKNDYGILPNVPIISILIQACSDNVQSDRSLVQIAEKLFKMTFDIIHEGNIGIRIFSSLLNVYSRIGDYQSCIDMLLLMENNDKFPNPNGFCIAPTLKAISVYNRECVNEDEKLSKKEKWKLIDQVLEIRNRLNIPSDTVTYSILFNLCDGDRKRISKLYNKMINEEQLKPNLGCLENILLGGLDGFIQESNENDVEIKEYIDWVIAEMTKYNVSFRESLKVKLARKLNTIKNQK